MLSKNNEELFQDTPGNLSVKNLKVAMSEASNHTHKLANNRSNFKVSYDKANSDNKAIQSRILTELGCSIFPLAEEQNTTQVMLGYHEASACFVEVNATGYSTRINVSIYPPFGIVLPVVTLDELKVSMQRIHRVYLPREGSLGSQHAFCKFMLAHCTLESVDVGYVQSKTDGSLVLNSKLRSNIMYKAFSYLNSSLSLALADIAKKWWQENKTYMTSIEDSSNMAYDLFKEARLVDTQLTSFVVSRKNTFRGFPDVALFNIEVSSFDRVAAAGSTIKNDSYVEEAFASISRLKMFSDLIKSFEGSWPMQVEYRNTRDSVLAAGILCSKEDAANLAAEFYATMAMSNEELLDKVGFKKSP